MDIGYLLSSNPNNMYFYREFSWKQTFVIGKPINDYFVFFKYFLTGQPIKFANLRL